MNEEVRNEIKKEVEKVIVPLAESLSLLSKAIGKICDITGATKRANEIREEIQKFGWAYCEAYHCPENNFQDPAAVQLFEMYKFIYEDMKRKGEISGEGY